MADLENTDISEIIKTREENKIREVGLAQRFLMWAILVSLLGIFIPFSFFLIIPFRLYAVYRFARALSIGIVGSILYTAVMFIPFIALICLLVLNRQATRILKDAGIRVGLMGAKTSDLPSPKKVIIEQQLSVRD